MSFGKALFGLALLLCLAAAATPAHATIILEGSDAIGCHTTGCAGDGGGGAEIYRDQVWKAIGGADPRPIAVIGVGNGVPIVSTTHAVVDFATVGAAGPLSSYVALYFVAAGGCCLEDDTLPAGNEAAISAYLAAGGTIMIENYTGGAAWDFAVGTGGAGNAHVGGFGGGVATGAGCDDGETVTAAGLTNGFTQPPAIGCWTHQGYQQSFFGPLGFTLSFFDSPASYDPALGPWSSLLSNGVTVTGAAAPEPASLLLLGSGFLGLAAVARLRRQK